MDIVLGSCDGAQIPMGYDMNGMGVIVNSEGTCSSGGSATDGHVDVRGISNFSIALPE